MTYTLYIANKRYSSWSMRPWLVLSFLRIPFDEKVQFFQDGWAQPQFYTFSPTGKVPCLHDSKPGSTPVTVWDSLAIIEYLAEKHEGVWPADPAARAFARSAAAEMHSGFNSLRAECPMNVGIRVRLGQESNERVKKDIARLSVLFEEGLRAFGGPWLAGPQFTAVDAFYAPIASRLKTYGIEVKGGAGEYIDMLFDHPDVQAWVKAGISETARSPEHEDECLEGGRVLLEELSSS